MLILLLFLGLQIAVEIGILSPTIIEKEPQDGPLVQMLPEAQFLLF